MKQLQVYQPHALGRRRRVNDPAQFLVVRDVQLAQAFPIALGDGEAPIGIEVGLDDDLPPVATLFAESQGRIVVSCATEHTAEVLRIAEEHGVPAAKIGSVAAAGGPFRILMSEGKVEADLAQMADAYFGALPNIMDAPSTLGS